MRQVEAQELGALVQVLQKAATAQSLSERAMDACKHVLAASELHPLGWDIEETHLELKRIAMVFQNTKLGYPYIETTLTINVHGNRVGTYRLITLLNGEVDDDYLSLDKP